MSIAPAFTVQDAAKTQATQLRLVHRRLAAVPTGIAALTSLTSLHLSENPLQELQTQHPPSGLKELVLAGCQLHGAIPSSLTQLTALEQLDLSANSTTTADAVFACQNLVHACLAYNNISTLISTTSKSSSASAHADAGTRDSSSCGSTKASSAVARISSSPKRSSSAAAPSNSADSSNRQHNRVSAIIASSSRSVRTVHGASPSQHTALESSQLMCLDLSHNDITDLSTILQQLQQMPKLRALHLKGNPVSLLSRYRSSVLQQLPQLVYLDGQKLDDLRALPVAPAGTSVSSQPTATAATQVGQQCIPANGAAVTAPAGTEPAAAAAAAAPSASLASSGTAAAAEGAQGAGVGIGSNNVLITLELDKLQVAESAAAVFTAVSEAAAAQYLRLVQQEQEQQQQEQQADLQSSRPPSAAQQQAGIKAARCSNSGAGTARHTSSSGGSCPNTARSAGSTAGGSILSGSKDQVRGAGAMGVSSSSGSSGDGSGSTVAIQPDVPLLPLRYHLEACGPDGASFCSAAVVVQPQLQPATAGEGGAAGASAAAGTAAASAADAKKAGPGAAKGAKGQEASKAAAPSKARPGSSLRSAGGKAAAPTAAGAQQAEAAGAVEAAATSLQPGRLLVQLCVPADVATKNWLRSGFDVKLRRTYFQPVPIPPPVPEVSSDTQIPAEQPPPAAEATSTAAQAALPFSGAATSAPAVASKAAPTTAVKAVSKPPGSSSSGGTTQGSKHRISSSGSAGPVPAATPVLTWQHVFKQEDIGSARVCTPSLVEGSISTAQAAEAAGSVVFAPPAPLMHPVTHIRLALKEAQQLQQQSVGSCSYKVVLHS